VSWAQRLFSRWLERRIRDLPFSVAQVPTLLMLAETGELSQKELVQGAVIEQPAMAQILMRMEASDLVARYADTTDGRSKRFRLTRKAKSKLGDLTRILAAGNDQALAGFSPAERAQLIALLQRVIKNLTPERDPATSSPARGR
jgi:DNA-binding MarR family transcriptional regulator